MNGLFAFVMHVARLLRTSFVTCYGHILKAPLGLTMTWEIEDETLVEGQKFEGLCSIVTKRLCKRATKRAIDSERRQMKGLPVSVPKRQPFIYESEDRENPKVERRKG